MFEIKVISLERTPERLLSFRGQNSHLRCSVFPAIDGASIDSADLEKWIEPGFQYRSGALGNAISHQMLWREVVESNLPLTICEDDAIFHKNFEQLSENIISKLDDDWDICFWGWNFDSIFHCSLPMHLGESLMYFDQQALRDNVQNYLKSDSDHLIVGLFNAFGTICYSISPKGAAIFLSQTNPIKKMNVFFPGLNKSLENVALDISMNALYPLNKSFACFPPLVITKNEIEVSTVQTPRSPSV